MRAPTEALAELADDAETLARLHDRELDAATIAALREVGFPDNLALLPPSAEAVDAWAAMRAALSSIPNPPQAADLDALAVEYAAIYLTGAYGASPAESVWLDQDHIACQQPMFELREIYQAAGLAAENWRKRPDDHLVLQLQYIARMLRRAASADFPPADLAGMMDAHLLRWLPDFAARVAARAAHPFHAALAHLTVIWCHALRDVLGGPQPG
ncbi:MAG: molecular chaperone TorD family protein [Sulfurisoma sp.]|nr:molecular chaperone TorD family protein [Sulfurisoma sp.]